MKKTLIIIIVLFLTNPLTTQILAQQPQIYSDYALAEKIYLQTDGLVYTSDQKIWFKGVVVHGSDLTPTQLSGVLYVDLINAYEEIVESKILKLEAGIGNGSFKLNTKMAPGKYQIRAYTNWNLNFGDNFTFKQYVDIYPPSDSLLEADVISDLQVLEVDGIKKVSGEINVSRLDSLHRGKVQLYVNTPTKKDSFLIKRNRDSEFLFEYPLEEDAEVISFTAISNNGQRTMENVLLDDKRMDVQFFPEGGSLVHGVVSKVGFKAIDAAGLGKEVTGKIYNSDNEFITEFSSNDLGMGLFPFEPYYNHTYYALINGQKFKFPAVQKEGTVMALKKSGDKIILEAFTSSDHNDLQLDVKAKGIIQKQMKLKPENGRLRVVLKSEDFVEGILNFRLIDAKTPLASRSYFNLKSGNRFNAQLSSIQASYKQREKGAISIELPDYDMYNNGANASLLILNKEELGEIQGSRSNILTHLLLTSELKGTIEDPMRYFDESNKNAWQDIEALMLTQGWSRYKYKKTLNLDQASLKYQPEPGLMVRGNLTGDRKGKRAKENIGLTLATFGSESAILNQTSNNEGEFAFQVPDEYGEQMKVLIQTSKKGKQRTFNIHLDEHDKPEIDFNQMQSVARLNSEVEKLVDKHQERKLIEDAWRVERGTRDLGEVVVEDYELTPNREKVMERFGMPETVVEGDEIRSRIDGKNYGLYGVLMREFPEEVRIDRIPIFTESGQGWSKPIISETIARATVNGDEITLVVVDGIPVRFIEYRFLENMPVDEIKSLEIIRQPDNFEELFFELIGRASIPFVFMNYSIISIHTYAGKGLVGLKSTPGMFTGSIPVYSIEEEFYAPKYENLTKRDWLKPDRRALIHWEPNVNFHSDGKAEVEFYNTDNLGEMLVVLEVISDDGRIAYKTTTFEVQEQKDQ